jgi:hypothetical protein
MLCNLTSTDKVRLVTSAAAAIDVTASYFDASTADPPVPKGSTSGFTPTAITTATTTDIVAAPAASTLRNVKTIVIRNKDATLSCDVTVTIDRSGTAYEQFKTTLNTGDTLTFTEGVGYFKYTGTAKLDAKLVVSSDVVNATTSFADITGLTVALKSGKKYAFESVLIHQTNATTTAAFFGVNIGAAPTSLIVVGETQITTSVTAATWGSTAATTARDTSINLAGTTGPGAVNMFAYVSGFIQPSADGTFAMRCASEVAVASGLTVKAGSWLRIWECDN